MTEKEIEQARKAVEEHLRSVLSELGDIIVTIGEDFCSMEDVFLDLAQDGTVKLTIGDEHLQLRVHVLKSGELEKLRASKPSCG